MAVKRTFGELLREARAAAEMTQQQLADLTGLTRVHIADLEGERNVPGWHTVQKLAKALNVPVEDLKDL